MLGRNAWRRAYIAGSMPGAGETVGPARRRDRDGRGDEAPGPIVPEHGRGSGRPVRSFSLPIFAVGLPVGGWQDGSASGWV